MNFWDFRNFEGLSLSSSQDLKLREEFMDDLYSTGLGCRCPRIERNSCSVQLKVEAKDAAEMRNRTSERAPIRRLEVGLETNPFTEPSLTNEGRKPWVCRILKC